MIYSILVKPNSKKGPLVIRSCMKEGLRDQPAERSNDQTSNQFAGRTGTPELTVYLREKPVDGSANLALQKVLAEYFHVPKTCVNIQSGARGRRKLVEVVGKIENF